MTMQELARIREGMRIRKGSARMIWGVMKMTIESSNGMPAKTMASLLWTLTKELTSALLGIRSKPMPTNPIEPGAPK